MIKNLAAKNSAINRFERNWAMRGKKARMRDSARRSVERRRARRVNNATYITELFEVSWRAVLTKTFPQAPRGWWSNERPARIGGVLAAASVRT